MCLGNLKVVHWIRNINNETGSLIENAELFFEIDDILKKEPLKVAKEIKTKMKIAINKYSPIIQLLEEIDETGLKQLDCKISMKPKKLYDALLFLNGVKPLTFFEKQTERINLN